MSDSVRPHGRQPTRLLRPWDSPGKNTGVGCHFLLQCMKVKSESEVAQSCPTSLPHGRQPTRLLRPWDLPGKSTGVGCHCLLPSFMSEQENQAGWFQFWSWFPGCVTLCNCESFGKMEILGPVSLLRHLVYNMHSKSAHLFTFIYTL